MLSLQPSAPVAAFGGSVGLGRGTAIGAQYGWIVCVLGPQAPQKHCQWQASSQAGERGGGGVRAEEEEEECMQNQS